MGIFDYICTNSTYHTSQLQVSKDTSFAKNPSGIKTFLGDLLFIEKGFVYLQK